MYIHAAAAVRCSLPLSQADSLVRISIRSMLIRLVAVAILMMAVMKR
jgi:hypothetical protein